MTRTNCDMTLLDDVGSAWALMCMFAARLHIVIAAAELCRSWDALRRATGELRHARSWCAVIHGTTRGIGIHPRREHAHRL